MMQKSSKNSSIIYNLEISDRAKKQIKRFPPQLKKRAQKSFQQLLSDPNYPGLHRKKLTGSTLFEARLTYHYRFIFSIKETIIEIISIGPHDEGLGKK